MNLTKSTGNLTRKLAVSILGKIDQRDSEETFHLGMVFSIIAWIERDEITVITFNLISQSLSAESHVLNK